MFELIKESRNSHPVLCTKALLALLDVLQGNYLIFFQKYVIFFKTAPWYCLKNAPVYDVERVVWTNER